MTSSIYLLIISFVLYIHCDPILYLDLDMDPGGVTPITKDQQPDVATSDTEIPTTVPVSVVTPSQTPTISAGVQVPDVAVTASPSPSPTTNSTSRSVPTNDTTHTIHNHNATVSVNNTFGQTDKTMELNTNQSDVQVHGDSELSDDTDTEATTKKSSSTLYLEIFVSIVFVFIVGIICLCIQCRNNK
jgi:hypothetical protein